MIATKKIKEKDFYDKKLLEKKTALITGASKGIGRAIAIEFARHGANIIINFNKNEKTAMEVVEEIMKYKVDAFPIKADVSNFEEVKGMMFKIKEKFGNIDILVNNAGILSDKTLVNMDSENWKEVIDINLTGIYNVTKNTVPLLKENGRIINISSIVGLDGNFGQTNYAASKAGVIGFTKSLAKELAKKKITVNAIAPGFIKTDMTESIPHENRGVIENRILLKELGMPKDIANAALFLASSKSRYITSEVLRVDGGLSL